MAEGIELQCFTIWTHMFLQFCGFQPKKKAIRHLYLSVALLTETTHFLLFVTSIILTSFCILKIKGKLHVIREVDYTITRKLYTQTDGELTSLLWVPVTCIYTGCELLYIAEQPDSWALSHLSLMLITKTIFLVLSSWLYYTHVCALWPLP